MLLKSTKITHLPGITTTIVCKYASMYLSFWWRIIPVHFIWKKDIYSLLRMFLISGVGLGCCHVVRLFGTGPSSLGTWYGLVESYLAKSGKWLRVTVSAVRPKLISQQCDNCSRGINFRFWSEEQFVGEMAPQSQIDVDITTTCHLNGTPATDRWGD